MKTVGARVVKVIIWLVLPITMFVSVGCPSQEKSELTVYVSNKGLDTLNIEDYFLVVGDSVSMCIFEPGEVGLTEDFQIWREAAGTIGTLKVKYAHEVASGLKTAAIVTLREPTANNFEATITRGAEYIEATYTPATR